jgi:hypothetical protein
MNEIGREGAVQVELAVWVERNVVRPGEETPIEVTLTNRGDSPVVLNSRLGMGYPEFADRDLYCEIRTGQQPYLGYQAFMMDYHRKELGEQFFRRIEPGESLRKTFDLQEWYRLVQPGDYVVWMVYDPERYAPHPEAVAGPIPSQAVTITVRE